MSDQQPNFQQEMSINHPNLSTAAHHHPLAAPTATGEKRPSHFSSLSSQEPSSKRPNLSHAPPPSAAADGGYTTLPLPMSLSHLARTSSGTILKPPPKETSNSIQRTVSDPSPFKKLTSSGSPSCGESPSVKRLMRMRERMKEMSQWWNQVLSEDEDDDTQIENCNSDDIPKEESETETEKPSQEAVWVDRNGDSLVLNFRCPCGDGYQILLSGNNCYYKLTSF